jgi:3-hydroxyisobutyryl-CoA hydrolase
VHFFKQEYEADSFIAKIKKPIVFVASQTSTDLLTVSPARSWTGSPVSLLHDGVVANLLAVGGGVGLSAHATFRVATENTVFAMPETTIGLFPDVGASFMLSRLDGKIGLWLGLTSDRMTGYDCYRTGIATHYIPAERLPQLEARLAELDYPSAPQKATELVNTVLNEFQADEAMMSDLKCSVEGDKRRAIDFAFSKPSVLEILKALKSIEEGQQFAGKGLESWAKQTRETMSV